MYNQGNTIDEIGVKARIAIVENTLGQLRSDIEILYGKINPYMTIPESNEINFFDGSTTIMSEELSEDEQIKMEQWENTPEIIKQLERIQGTINSIRGSVEEMHNLSNL